MKKNLLKTLILSVLCLFVAGVDVYADNNALQVAVKAQERVYRKRSGWHLTPEDEAKIAEFQQIEKESLEMEQVYVAKAKEIKAQIPEFEEKAKIVHEQGNTSEEEQLQRKIEDQIGRAHV